MSGRLNRVRQAISSPTGTGGPLVLGSTAYSNAYLTIAGSGGVDQTEYCYIIEEGNDWEIQRGLWTSSSNQLARNTPIQSSIAGVAGTTKLTLAGTAFIRIIADSKELSSLVGVRTVTGTTDTINDSHSNVLTVYNSAAAVAVSIAAPSGNNFKSGWIGYYKNIGAGAATVTATGASIYSDGVSSSAFTLNQYESAIIFSDGTIYYAFITRQPLWLASLTTAQKASVKSNTKISGPTVSVLNSGTSATYTPPSNCTRIRVRGCGGGGGTGNLPGSGQTDGSSTTFSNGTITLTGTGGAKGTGNAGPFSAGGSGSGGDINYSGGDGQGGVTQVAGSFSPAANGGGTFMFPFGNRSGAAADTNSGCGAGCPQLVGVGTRIGCGAGGGGFEKWIDNPLGSTWTYTIGGGGSAGTGGYAGAAGRIVIEEFYD